MPEMILARKRGDIRGIFPTFSILFRILRAEKLKILQLPLADFWNKKFSISLFMRACRQVAS